MRTYFFDIVTTRDLTGEADADKLFEVFEGDVTPTVSNDTPLLACSVEAPSFLTAVRRTIRHLRRAGFEVVHVQVEPDAVMAS